MVKSVKKTKEKRHKYIQFSISQHDIIHFCCCFFFPFFLYIVRKYHLLMILWISAFISDLHRNVCDGSYATAIGCTPATNVPVQKPRVHCRFSPFSTNAIPVPPCVRVHHGGDDRRAQRLVPHLPTVRSCVAMPEPNRVTPPLSCCQAKRSPTPHYLCDNNYNKRSDL